MPARLGMRERSKTISAAIRAGDAAPYPWVSVNERLWRYVDELGLAL